jgi:hypothetical protein
MCRGGGRRGFGKLRRVSFWRRGGVIKGKEMENVRASAGVGWSNMLSTLCVGRYWKGGDIMEMYLTGALSKGEAGSHLPADNLKERKFCCLEM